MPLFQAIGHVFDLLTHLLLFRSLRTNAAFDRLVGITSRSWVDVPRGMHCCRCDTGNVVYSWTEYRIMRLLDMSFIRFRSNLQSTISTELKYRTIRLFLLKSSSHMFTALVPILQLPPIGAR